MSKSTIHRTPNVIANGYQNAEWLIELRGKVWRKKRGGETRRPRYNGDRFSVVRYSDGETFDFILSEGDGPRVVFRMDPSCPQWSSQAELTSRWRDGYLPAHSVLTEVIQHFRKVLFETLTPIRLGVYLSDLQRCSREAGKRHFLAQIQDLSDGKYTYDAEDF